MPRELVTPGFRLEPLGPQHADDHEAWPATSPAWTDVRSWVRADRADLDPVLHQAVSAWIARDWPFTTVAYAPR